MSNSNRRAFLRSIAVTGLSAPLLPRALDAQIQAGTMAVSVETIRAAAQLAGLTWTEEECGQLTDALSRMAKGAEGIDRRSLTNASPLPVHFNPRPPGVRLEASPATFRLAPRPQPPKPASVEALAFATIPELAAHLRARHV